MTRNRLFLRWLLVLGGIVAGIIFLIAAPLMLVDPAASRIVLLAIPPNLFVALSWMAGAWHAHGRQKPIAMILTMGMIPVRLTFFLAWTWMIHRLLGSHLAGLVLTMMLFWILFAIPEFAMLLGFARNEQYERQKQD